MCIRIYGYVQLQCEYISLIRAIVVVAIFFFSFEGAINVRAHFCDIYIYPARLGKDCEIPRYLGLRHLVNKMADMIARRSVESI